MFTELTQIINQAGLSRLTLSLQPSGNNRIAVVVTITPNTGDAEVPKLRQSLASELSIEGTLTELEEGFISHLKSFGDSFVEAAVLANTTEATRQHADATETLQQDDDKGSDLKAAVADSETSGNSEELEGWGAVDASN